MNTISLLIGTFLSILSGLYLVFLAVKFLIVHALEALGSLEPLDPQEFQEILDTMHDNPIGNGVFAYGNNNCVIHLKEKVYHLSDSELHDLKVWKTTSKGLPRLCLKKINRL